MTIGLRWAAVFSAWAVALATLIPLTGFARSAQAAEAVAFTIPTEDGYGIADCMSTKASSCGQDIADAWCASHGSTRAVAFGAADVTGEIPLGAAPPPPPGPLVIRCD